MNGAIPASESLIVEAWKKLTAAVLIGAHAAGDVETAVRSLRETVDTFLLETMRDVGMDREELGAMAGEYAIKAHALLTRELAGLIGGQG